MAEKAWDPDTRTEREVDHYKIVHKDGTVVGKANTKKGATRSLDRHDNNYGSYAHKIKTIFKEDIVTDEDLIESAEGHSTHVVKAFYSDKNDDQFSSSGVSRTKVTPSKIFNQNINVSARDKHQAVNKVGVHLAQKGFRVHSLKHVGLKEEVELAENNKFAPKKLKDIIPKPSKERHEWKGNTEDEKAIIAKLDANTVRHPDRNGNGDDVFKGSKIERDEKHVWPGNDEKNYDEWNNGASKK